ncbi:MULTISPECIES: hypothetical protein [unclassified Pseudomonas]|uniref:hypothetical protein n=1 Tax=unclassified Pseudomonas TaxID=196821 RepID=UPI001F2DF461|nr:MULTISPECIES: hypothetical protein [unclassified Pseudomonas]MCF5228573.1 hypothetical protein [Pseudomonas sp. PA-5-4H]MCF5236224.1 hypothetical protein [Pseudomonas sp. PA-5-4G]MCF5247432.1 hypothetical protein [Pseudomonas sp. PA-5-4B]MCF5253582.1 hypothetical protein [Pseudomonas sp. PA-5-4B]MCF5262772.1 hypothetical protein [Pseudomonas sp. PA-5-4A]
MIGVPMPNPRDSIIENLNQQLDAYFGAGKTAQVIPNGVGVDGPFNGTTAHHERLRKERDKLAPAVRAEAAKGVVASVAAMNLGMHIKRVMLIAQENGFKFADTP